MSEIGKRITVAMITMNEEGAVGKVIGDIQNVVPGAEIVIVDSSSDRTAEIAQSLGARVIKQFPPRGYGPAMDRALLASEREVGGLRRVIPKLGPFSQGKRYLP